MAILPVVQTALRGLRAYPLRSALAPLGIAVGAAALVIVLAMGSGARAEIREQMRRLGTDVLIIVSGSTKRGGLREGLGSRLSLTDEDAAAIAQEVPWAVSAAPVVRRSAQVVFGNRNWPSPVNGVTPEYLEASDWPVRAGQFFTEEETRAALKVAVLGETVVEKLFGDEDPIGQVIRMKHVPFTVVGVLADKGQSAWGQDQDHVVVIPLRTARHKLAGWGGGPRAVTWISVRVSSPGALQEATAEITALLRERHRLGPDDADDFIIRNFAEILEAHEESGRTVRMMLASLAGLSLVVGGIGILNVMLASVTARTREIGIRLVVGARVRDIRGQFLLEALGLAVAGGLAGIVLGLVGTALIAPRTGLPATVRLPSIVVAFASAALTGLLSGYLPARRASLLEIGRAHV